MAPKRKSKEIACWNMKNKFMCWHVHKSGGAFYGLGFLGSLVYYLSTATSLWMGFAGFLKSLVWPAYLVYGALKFLGM